MFPTQVPADSLPMSRGLGTIQSLFQAPNLCNFLRTLAKLQPCNHNNPSVCGGLQVDTLGVTSPSPCKTYHLQFLGLREGPFVLLVVVADRGFRAEGAGGRHYSSLP